MGFLNSETSWFQAILPQILPHLASRVTEKKGPRWRPLCGLFIQLDNLFHVDFEIVPLFVNFTLQLNLILRGDGHAVPALIVDLDVHRAALIAEGLAVVGEALGDVAAQFHPAIVL